MKQYFAKRIFNAGAALLFIPALSFAQKETDKVDKEDKKEVQQIIITRKGDTDEKTVIEIKGDKVTVNGKDAAKSDDVTVRLHNLPNGRTVFRTNGNRDFNFDLNNDFNLDLNSDLNDRVSLFTEDANRAMLGVVTDEDERGARITSITKESGAEKAGLKKGDIITKIGDAEIDDADDVAKAVRKHKPGDKITITVLRDGKEQKLNAELGKWKGVRINNLNTVIPPSMPDAPDAPDAYTTPFRVYAYGAGSTPKLGLSVQDTDDGKGVKVLQVAEESNAAKAGVKKDDIITHINDEQVDGTDDVVRSMREARNEATVRLQVLRDGKPQNIEVRIPRKLKTADL
jgi:serine protease Do